MTYLSKRKKFMILLWIILTVLESVTFFYLHHIGWTDRVHPTLLPGLIMLIWWLIIEIGEMVSVWVWAKKGRTD